jgi:hypothetical protein
MSESCKDKLKKMTAWDTTPALTETELDDLLSNSSMTDKDGFAPLDEEWTPTYDLNAAASAGWLIKAGRTTSTTETEPDSINVTSKIFDNCRTMARIYKAKCTAFTTIR